MHDDTQTKPDIHLHPITRPGDHTTEDLLPIRGAHEELLELAHAADIAVKRNRDRHNVLVNNPVKVTTQIAVEAISERSPYHFALETALRMHYILITDLGEQTAAVEAGDITPTGHELEALTTLTNLTR